MRAEVLGFCGLLCFVVACGLCWLYLVVVLVRFPVGFGLWVWISACILVWRCYVVCVLGDFVCGGFSIMVALLALGWD